MAQRVLVVEDTEELRFLFRFGLEQEGFEVIEAANGLEMISILQVQDVDAMVVDIGMPHVDGVSAIGTIKAMPQHRDVLVIVVTAASSPDVQARALAAGATELLTKPISPIEIAQVIRRYLS